MFHEASRFNGDLALWDLSSVIGTSEFQLMDFFNFLNYSRCFCFFTIYWTTQAT